MALGFYECETTSRIILQLLQWHLLVAGEHLAVYRDDMYLMLTVSRSHNNHTELLSFTPAYLFICILKLNKIIFKFIGS